MAPSGGISIPAHDNVSNGAPADDQNWNGNDRRSPPRDSRDRERDRDRERNGDPPRRSSRSRSPARGGEDRERASRSENGGQNPGNNLHVSGLSHRVDSRDLETAFAKIGRVQKASVMYDPHTRESRGFGFVTMETTEEAEAAISSLNGTELMGKIITIEKARRGRARTPTPGRYYGPPKRYDYERPYDPRPYDSRYRDYDDRRDRRRYDDYRRDDYRHRDYDRDRERDRYRDDRRYDDRRY
ncbi:hypothetical protein CC1G_13772 [Coprinopsis cinerea okayama7|uniref:RRM domain-containing protein n=1 Tax=Coprinopsis cinerea (strain Okayama-7 / 130 / ATCC MYA-4618 / FGSC 9003) TaxID=240176 RepID=D6RKB9_COPC7|nr:hypothetical protein CC1G_13772 [Coprinopsis cinerea okayama7\|eukprot:XP_002912240.1 hypothetical protein CC1G_13772 [Coprinopsis cinerea okayama7\